MTMGVSHDTSKFVCDNIERVWNRYLKEQYPDAHPLILKTLDIIERCYSGKINQKELAQELNVSAEYFSYLFAKNTGETFSNFIRDYRIEQAKYLYRSGEIDKKEVPYAVGFSDAKLSDRPARYHPPK